MHTPVSICLACTLLAAPVFAAPPPPVHELQPAQIVPDTMSVIFSGRESLHYEVSWSGGVKIGDIHLAIVPAPSPKDAYNILAQVKSDGPLQSFYPVDDAFQCLVAGPMKLPLAYNVLQREGRKQKETLRSTVYSQEAGVVRYRKNQHPITLHSMPGTSYNEFSAFIITRALNFAGTDILVPAFVEGKRHEVAVRLVGREQHTNIFGSLPTLKVQPIMQFKGLYEKSGDTTLWLTDDQCRVPVEIRSRIAIGALVARLTEYDNPACPGLKKQ